MSNETAYILTITALYSTGHWVGATALLVVLVIGVLRG